MSLWRRLFRRGHGQPPPDATGPEPAAPPSVQGPAPPAQPPAELGPLLQMVAGENVPLEKALSALAACRGGPRERAALDAIQAAKRRGTAPEPVLVAAADLAVQRGEAAVAIALLDELAGNAALLLAADVRAERGELARALALIERVLARDLDAPGARERHTRWRAQLGGGRAPALPLDAPTVLRAGAPESSFRIVGEAGRGGAGTVYEAFDEVLGRKLALKVYHRPEQERDKLEREARMAVQLAGSGVVRIYDADPGRGWIVMEWAAGGALKRWIGRADVAMLWPIERWFVPLASALERVHALGVVHGDIKPANVLFRGPDDPVFSDFGLARGAGQAIEGGSFGYVSPERLLAGRASVADDVYALGRILEDVLAALLRAPADARPPDGQLERWRRRAERALAAEASRPSLVELGSPGGLAATLPGA
jgi:eukaryotic-like serine/threonine-protein kinase